MNTHADILLSDSFGLIKEWRGINARLRDLEFERCQWCRRVRERFASHGDFTQWCIVNLKMTIEASGMVTLAIAGAVFATPVDLKCVDLSDRAVGALSSRTASEQEQILRKALKQRVRVMTIMGRVAVRAASAHASSASDDVRKLSDYLNRSGLDIPTEIRRIMSRYVKIARDRS